LGIGLALLLHVDKNPIPGREEPRMTMIESFMQREVITATPDESVEVVVKRMCEAEVGAVVITEGEKLLGVFSERDLLIRVVGQGRDPKITAGGGVATDDVVSVTRETSIRECVSLLQQHSVRHLPVLDEGRPVGIVSARDFFGKLTGEFEKLIDRLRYDEALREVADPYDHVGGGFGR
jgi:CBS domain-containing protein